MYQLKVTCQYTPTDESKIDPRERNEDMKANASTLKVKAVVKLSNAEFEHISGMKRRRRILDRWVKNDKKYMAAVSEEAKNPIRTSSSAEMLVERILGSISRHPTIHNFVASQRMAKLRIDSYIGKQSAMDKVANRVKTVLGNDGVLAWGSAQWAVTQKGL